MEIILVGFMASGKTTVGKLLAQKLNLNFIDLDELIEKKYNLKIAEIFTIYGEDTFRNFETEALCEVIKYKNVVVAAGGGTPCFNNNMLLIENNFKSIFLDTSIDVITARLKHDTTRPLAANGNLETLFIHRKSFYSKANICIKTESLSNIEIVSDIISKL